MKIVIDIDEDDYKVFVRQRCNDATPICRLYKAIKNGTVIQKGHGRLIDADELLKAIDTWDKFGYTAERNLIRLNQDNKDIYVAYIHFDDSINCIKNMPTIIPADMGGNE